MINDYILASPSLKHFLTSLGFEYYDIGISENNVTYWKFKKTQQLKDRVKQLKERQLKERRSNIN